MAFRNKGEPSALGKGSSRLAQQCFRVERIRLYSRFLSDGRHLAEERCRFCNNRRLFILALPEGAAVPEISFNISRCGKIGPKRFLCFFAAWSPVAFFAKCFGKELFLIVRGAAFCPPFRCGNRFGNTSSCLIEVSLVFPKNEKKHMDLKRAYRCR